MLTHICPDCGEVVDDAVAHPSCCEHEHVEREDDGGDDGLINRFFICHDCGSQVVPTEDGWEVLE